MTVAENRRAGCDGCGRSTRLEALTTVTMPNGDAVACCPRCEPHARSAAETASTLEQRRQSCDGCSRTLLETELEEVVLDDGTVVSCCQSCIAETPDDTAADADDDTAADADDDSAENRPTTTAHHRCTQCNDGIDVEPFRVTTVDGRTERLCPPCKVRAERDGIVSSVDMRETRARDVLGVDEDATEDEIRTAYRRNVKRAHPDRPTGSKSAFQLVTDAYDRLQTDD
ncbi:J domain-containing protein [Natrarchaeobius oligotrophus]|uniref:J domain-containing protein n=1 Tax=Natrarchaeobius chitinivorans TaxID=1679083 RepID=A0A3N6M6M9_NATCH|nr:J domain-containing protein [Natrarchaeobius chitinivorans]RQG96254.1 J domain-containing protein [Natrarchaeobius chitinivorans]